MPWYVYDPAGTDTSDPNQYTLVGTNPPACGTPKNFLCAIQANDNAGQPILTNINLFYEISNALNNRAESTNVKLRSTR